MKIDSVELWHVGLPLKQPLPERIGGQGPLQTVLVCLRSGETAGWGEASPGNAPETSAEWAGGVFGCLRDWLAPAVQGGSIEDGDQLADRLKAFRGNRFAKAALDCAWWDLAARQKQQPLPKLLGGREEAVEVGVSLDRMQSVDEFYALMGQLLQQGFARVKLMMRPGWDLSLVDFVRKEFPLANLHVDFQGDLSMEHFEMLCRLDDFGLAMVEQPLAAEDLVAHAMLQESIRTPICLSDSITTGLDAEMALDLKAGQFFALEPGRLGGLSTAVAIHNLAHDQCTPCWADALPQSGVGIRHAMALASLPNCTYPAEWFRADAWLADDLLPPLELVRPADDQPLRVPLWSDPGIGAEPDAAKLEQYSLDRATIGG